MHINDLQEFFQSTNYQFYADDTVLYASHSDELEAHGTIQHDLNRVVNWCNLNRITMNIKKTKSMVLGTKYMLKMARHYNILSNETEILYVDNFTYLGIKLDSKLDFESHATECLRLVWHKLYPISKVRNILNSQHLQSLNPKHYRTLIMETFSLIRHILEQLKNSRNYKIEPSDCAWTVIRRIMCYYCTRNKKYQNLKIEDMHIY